MQIREGDLEEFFSHEVQFSCKVLDPAHIVNCLSTAGLITFKEYVENAFIPRLQSHLNQEQTSIFTCDKLNQ